jgi:hypothetical protein
MATTVAVRPRLGRAAAVAVAGGVAIALGAMLPWYAATGTGAQAGAFAAGRGLLATTLLGVGAIVAAASLTRQAHAWLAAAVGAVLTLTLGTVAVAGAGDGLRHAGVDPGAMPLGQGPSTGLVLLLCGGLMALAGAGLLWREGRR